MDRPADVVTIDAVERPPGGNRRWQQRVRAALASPLPGLRSATVNHANTGTHDLVPHVPPGSAVVLAWDSAEAAAAAWAGPLRGLLDGPGRFSLDGQVARACTEHPEDTWHGWRPSDEDAEEIDAKDPVAVIVHGVLRPRHLPGFLRDNLHAASRAAHNPGHRGSVDVSSALPFEHTSISLWKTLTSAQDYAYAPGGHPPPAMHHARQADTHRVGVFLRVRPLASTGGLGGCGTAYPDLPRAVRG